MNDESIEPELSTKETDPAISMNAKPEGKRKLRRVARIAAAVLVLGLFLLPPVRTLTVSVAGRFGAVGLLRAAMRDPAAAVRVEASRSLGTLGKESIAALPALYAALTDGSVEVQVAAAEAVWRVSGDVEKPLALLIASLEHRDVSIRISAAVALGEMGSAAEPALQTLHRSNSDSDAAFRICAATAVWRINQDEEALAVLVRESESSSSPARAAAIDSLGEYGVWNSELKATLQHLSSGSDLRVKHAADNAISKLQPADNRDLMRDLLSNDVRNRRRAAEELSQQRDINAESVKQLAVLVREDTDNFVRLRAADALRNSDSSNKDLIAALSQALSDRMPAVRRAAARSLKNLKPHDPVLIEPLSQALLDPDEEIRATAAALLGGVDQSNSAIEALLGALSDNSAKVREAACDTLGQIQPADLRVTSAMGKLLDDNNDELRMLAVIALGKAARISTEPALSVLIGATENSDAMVRRYAVDGLKQLGPDAAPGLGALTKRIGDQDEVVRKWAIQALAEMGESARAAAPRLAEALNDPNSDVRWEAVKALEKIGPAAAASQLAERLADSELRIREPAAAILKNLGPEAKDAVPVFIALMQSTDPAIRRLVLDTLQGLGSEAIELVPSLIDALSDESPFIRIRAAFALGNIPAKGQVEAALVARLNDKEAPVAAEVAIALGKVGAGSEVREALQASIESGVSDVRLCSAVALTKLDPSVAAIAMPVLMAELPSWQKDRAARSAAEKTNSTWRLERSIEALEYGDNRFRPPSRSTISEPEVLSMITDLNREREAISALARLGSAATEAGPILAMMLDGERRPFTAGYNAAEIIGIIDALSTMGSAAVLAKSALNDALDSPDAEVRLAADKALSKIESVTDAAIVAMLANATNHTDIWVQIWAIRSLMSRRVMTPKLGETLRHHLSSEEDELKHLAAEYLARIEAAHPSKPPRTVSDLSALLSNPEPQGRADAALELGRHGAVAAQAVPVLTVVLLKDDQAEVRKSAAVALGMIGPAASSAAPALVNVLEASDADEAADALVKIGGESVPTLIQALSKHDAPFGSLERVVNVLGRIGPAAKDAVPVLSKLLDANNSYADEHVAEALGKIGPAAAAALPVLERVLNRPRTGTQAAGALWRIAGRTEVALPHLIEALTSEHVRGMALPVLAEMGPAATEAVHALVRPIAARTNIPTWMVTGRCGGRLSKFSAASETRLPRKCSLKHVQTITVICVVLPSKDCRSSRRPRSQC